MKIVFVYKGERDFGSTSEKTFILPDAKVGAIAVVNGDGRLIELATIFQAIDPRAGAGVEVLWPADSEAATYEDTAALGDAVIDRRDERKRERFRQQLAAYGERIPAPTPFKIALFANRLSHRLNLDIGKLDLIMGGDNADLDDDDGGLAGHADHPDGGLDDRHGGKENDVVTDAAAQAAE